MDSMTIDAMLVVNMQSNEEESNNNSRVDLLTSSYRNVSSSSAVLDAEVVNEQNLEQEVQARLDSMTIDAMLVVNMSSNEEENKNNKARTDSRRNATAILQITGVIALIILILLISGTVLGTRNRPHKPLATIVAAPPTPSISVLEFARNILTPLSGEEALLHEFSPQYKTLSWMVRDDPANMMMKMMVGNETQSPPSSSSMLKIIVMERYIMALLYFSTDGPNWVSPYDFLGVESICDWGGRIQCSKEGAAVRISIGKSVSYNFALHAFPF
jgi:hypothetical protein